MRNEKREPGFGRPGGGKGRRKAMARPVDKARDFKGTLKRLVGYLQPHRFHLLAVFLLAILSTVFSIVSPKIMGLATTQLFEDMMQKTRQVPGAAVNYDYIFNILILLAILYIAGALFTYAQRYVMASIAQKTVYDLRQDVNLKLSRLPLNFFDSHPHGDLLSRVTNDIDNIASTLQQSLIQLITAVTTLLGVIIMMLTISPGLTLVSMIILPLSGWITRMIASRSQKYFARQQEALGNLNGHVEEMFTGHQVVKAFGLEQHSIEKFETINQELYDASWQAQFVSSIIMPLLSLVSNINYVIVCVVGGIMVANRAVTIGDIQAFMLYTRQFAQPIVQTANIVNIIQSTIASAERVFKILDEEEEIPDRTDARVIAFPRGEVRFEDVRFSYKKEVPLIEDLNIDIKPGQTIAIVGPTGAGKTTLVNLLMRFYELDGGRITVDGIDIRDIHRGSLRSIFGMVLQDTWLFHGTIRDNIAYGRPEATNEEIVQAARAAHADHFIQALPEGYNTILNEEASNISQGQKQLLTIARTILADPAILILDEATSSVDTRTEIYIQKAMSTLMQGRTSLVIAHRLSTIRNADIILVIVDGRVMEKGSHQELLAQDGFYADLYLSQFRKASNHQTG